MRLWSLHPKYLDRVGLVAWWRESLLAQAVLAERTRGYRQHPQLTRFREVEAPLEMLGAYLGAIADQAELRGYRFDRGKILSPADASEGLPMIDVTNGQIAYESRHLRAKLLGRSPTELVRLDADPLEAHPCFRVVEGEIAAWERV